MTRFHPDTILALNTELYLWKVVDTKRTWMKGRDADIKFTRTIPGIL